MTETSNTVASAQLVRLAALAAVTEAVLRRNYRSRPDGVAARAALSALYDREIEAAAAPAQADLYIALVEARGAAVDYLSRTIADLAPVVTVSAPSPLPSLYWAWRLYADPGRAGELTDRNRVRHPSFMPASFAALAR
jgi:prophage DNA circulation protein